MSRALASCGEDWLEGDAVLEVEDCARPLATPSAETAEASKAMRRNRISSCYGGGHLRVNGFGGYEFPIANQTNGQCVPLHGRLVGKSRSGCTDIPASLLGHQRLHQILHLVRADHILRIVVDA